MTFPPSSAVTSRANRPQTSPGDPSASPSTSPIVAGSTTPQLGLQATGSAPSSAGNAAPGLGLVSPAFSDPPPLVPAIISPLAMPAIASLGPHSFPAAPPGPGFSPAPPQRTPKAGQEPPKRRGRTRISEEQLQVLRQHFHINSPPSDALIREISAKTGLELKVIKHWYRNTLFKERQRDKDSPYNFSVPPSTSLNLAEYERTGRVEVRDANPKEAAADSAGGLRLPTDLPRRKRPLQHEEAAGEQHEARAEAASKRLRVEEEETLTAAQVERLMAHYKKLGPAQSAEQIAAVAAELGLSQHRVAEWLERARDEDLRNLNVPDAHEQIVAVSCPYCEIIFRLRSQVADHLRSAHPDQPKVDPASLPDG